MTRVILGGGLGNQLFQYAAGIYVSKDSLLHLDNSYGYARTSSENKIDLEDFQLPVNVKITKRKTKNKFLRKFLNLSFRESSTAKIRIIQTLEILWTITSKIFQKESSKLFINSGLGLDKRIQRVAPGSTLVGYFQCADISEDETLRDSLRKLRLKKQSSALQIQIENSMNLQPIFVHVRLTDYKSESKFGIPSMNYFESAIDALDLRNPKFAKPIWLFSDSPSEAMLLIPSRFHPRITIEPDAGLSPAETLELMRHGHGYVIANSSFSWWAAYLRYALEVPVVAPVPWFAGMKDPIGIYPSDWLRVSASS